MLTHQPTLHSYDGDLTITLSSGLSIRVPNSQFMTPFVEIGRDGARAYNESIKEFLYNSVGNQPATLGRYFLTAAYLMVNHDANSFTLWQGNPTSSSTLVPVLDEKAAAACGTASGVVQQSATATASASSSNGATASSSSSGVSTGAIVGAAIGGVAAVVAVAAIVAILFRRKRRQQRVAETTAPNTGDNDRMVPPQFLESKPSAVYEMPPGHERPELDERASATELPGAFDPAYASPWPVHEMDGNSHAVRS